jgi:hypothetical protein
MTVSAITSVRQVPLPGMLRSLPRRIRLNVDRVGVGDTVAVGVDVGLAVAVTGGVLPVVLLGRTMGSGVVPAVAMTGSVPAGVTPDQTPSVGVAWGRGGGTGVSTCAGGVARRTARVGVGAGAGVVA